MMLTEPKIVFDEDAQQTLVVVPIAFSNVNFSYYEENHCYLQFDPIHLPFTDEVSKGIMATASLQFGHILRCVDVSEIPGEGYCQISVRPLHGDNLLGRLRGVDLKVSIES